MSVVCPKAKEGFLSGQVNLLSDDIRVVILDLADYTYDPAHDYLNDVPGAARTAVSGAMTGKSVTNGIFDANDTVIPSVAGDQSEAVYLYKHTGTESTSLLIAYVDTFSSGAPLTPDGGNVTVAWDNGANKIFAI